MSKVKDMIVRNPITKALEHIPYIEGMSAYDSAVLAGWQGTEEDFYKALAELGKGGNAGIDDEHISTDTTYSSQKIEDDLESLKSEFVGKEDVTETVVINAPLYWVKNKRLNNSGSGATTDNAYMMNDKGMQTLTENFTVKPLQSGVSFRVAYYADNKYSSYIPSKNTGYISTEYVIEADSKVIISVTKSGITDITPYEIEDLLEISKVSTVTLKDEIKELKVRKPRMKFGAHQGARMKAPQNSIPAYELAGIDGWDYLWIAKCRMSADGTFYCMHDADVSTTTNGVGIIEEMTDAEINALVINQGANVSHYTEDELRVPTLEQALTICNKYDMKICFRIDSFPSYDTDANKMVWDNFINLIKEYGRENEIFSGSSSQLKILRTLVDNSWEANLYKNNSANADELISTLNTNNLHENVSVIIARELLTLEEVKKLHRNGIKVYAWDEKSVGNTDAKNLALWGVDILQNPSTNKVVF